MELLSRDRVMIILDETSSTNSELKQLQKKEKLPEGSIVMAEYQTHGRGQAGNTWFSDKGCNLLFSFILYPKLIAANKQFIISRIVSLAIKKVLDRYIDNISIKWPNDIYWKDKKIAGMLIENSLMGQKINSSIIGIGLNVNQDGFPKDLPNPVSMKMITRNEYSRDELLSFFLSEFNLLYQSLQNGGDEKVIESDYMRNLYRRDDYHWFEDSKERYKGRIIDVLPSGHLVIETLNNKEERIYAFKEVSFVL